MFNMLVSDRRKCFVLLFFVVGSHYLVTPPCVCTGCGQVKAQEELQDTKSRELFTLGLKILGKWTSWCLSTVQRDSRRGCGAAPLSTGGARPGGEDDPERRRSEARLRHEPREAMYGCLCLYRPQL